jgi:hypothetical protein
MHSDRDVAAGEKPPASLFQTIAFKIQDHHKAWNPGRSKNNLKRRILGHKQISKTALSNDVQLIELACHESSQFFYNIFTLR